MARGIRERVTKFNSDVDKIKDIFGTAPSEQYQILSRNARVLINAGKQKRGKIRSYEQTISFMKKSPAGRERLKKTPYTKQEYTKEVEKVLNSLGRRASFKGEYSWQRKDMLEKLSAYRESELLDFDFSKSKGEKMSTRALLDAFRKAAEKEREARRDTSYDSRDSETGWTSLLQTELEKIYNTRYRK